MYRQLLLYNGGGGVGLSYRDPKTIYVLRSKNDIYFTSIHRSLFFTISNSLNDSCRCITGCLRPTNVDSLYVLAGIAPPGVRRSVASRTERRRQADYTRHPCHNHQPGPKPPEIKEELPSCSPLSQPPQTGRLTLWEEQRIAKQHLAKLSIPTSEQIAPGHKSEWKLWKSLNRLRTGMGRSKTNLSKWGYADTAYTACECGTSEQTMQHLLRCPRS